MHVFLESCIQTLREESPADESYALDAEQQASLKAEYPPMAAKSYGSLESALAMVEIMLHRWSSMDEVQKLQGYWRWQMHCQKHLPDGASVALLEYAGRQRSYLIDSPRDCPPWMALMKRTGYGFTSPGATDLMRQQYERTSIVLQKKGPMVARALQSIEHALPSNLFN